MEGWKSGDGGNRRIRFSLYLLFELFSLSQGSLLPSLYAAEVRFAAFAELLMAETNRVTAF